MEKDNRSKNILKVAITGPESTGKTELAKFLAQHFGCNYIPEYARTYVENLHRKYNYLDVVHIARKQVELEKEFIERAEEYLFYDTELIITKIWFEQVFGICPVWIDASLRKSKIDLYLLCDTDLPWVPDPVRENGGEMREKLYALYETNIRNYGFPFRVIHGKAGERWDCALKAIMEFKAMNSQNNQHSSTDFSGRL